MCCFLGSVPVHVSATNIFARMMVDTMGRQTLAYSMSLTVGEEVAMVLPLPVAPGTRPNAVEFIDLSSCPTMFDELADLFDVPSAGFLELVPQSLEVHRVGSFVASYVPTRADFMRLDPRFRIGDVLFDAVPAYADHGFAVFQLARGASTIHPMGLSFPSRTPDRLFFPTVHVHDGTFSSTAEFDHTLYYQHPRATELGWMFGTDYIAPEKLADSYMGIAQRDRSVVRRTLHGTHANADVWIDAR